MGVSAAGTNVRATHSVMAMGMIEGHKTKAKYAKWLRSRNARRNAGRAALLSFLISMVSGQSAIAAIVAAILLVVAFGCFMLPVLEQLWTLCAPPQKVPRLLLKRPRLHQSADR